MELHTGLPVIMPMMSKIAAVASRPRGKTMSVGWIGCPNAFAPLAICRSRRIERAQLALVRGILHSSRLPNACYRHARVKE